MILTTPHLRLQPLRREDLTLTLYWRNEARAAFWSDGLTHPVEHDLWFARFDQERRRTGDELWVAFDTEWPVGQIALYEYDHAEPSRAQIGRMIVAPWARRRHYGQEMVRAMQQLAVGLSLSHLWLTVRETNRPARALYERTGFRAVGLDGKTGAVTMNWGVR